MTGKFDILIKRAKLRTSPDKLMEIGITAGKIEAIGENLGAATTEIDAQRNLVSESFANAHLHLCKVYTLDMMDEEAMKAYHGGGDMGSAMNSIELAARVKEKYHESWIIKNVRKAVAHAGIYGTTHIRAFADVDSKGKLEGVKALLKAREEFKGIVDLQVVAFAQDGVVREPGTEALVTQAMEMGADVVGGIPWIEYTDADIAEHVNVIFDIAKKFDKPVSMLVDDAGDTGLRSLEMMAVQTIKRGWIGRSLAHHARACAYYPKPYLAKVNALLKKAEMGLSVAPHTGPLHAPVKEMYADGVLVFIGQDDISDAYYAFGRNNMLEVAFLGAHTLWMTTRAEVEILYDMVTTRPAKAMGVKDFGLQVGKTANLVVLDQPGVFEALRYHEAPAYVISHGKLVDRAKMQQLIKTMEW